MNDSRIIPSITILLTVGIFFLYVNPMWSGAIATKRAAIAAGDQALVAAQQYTAQQNQLLAARDAIDPKNIAQLTTFLPDSVDNVGLILDLNALAARSGLSVSSIDVVTSAGDSSNNAPGALSSIGSVDLSLSAVGNFAALNTFLGGIERSERILDIHDLAVTGSDTGVYSYKMTIRLYWLR